MPLENATTINDLDASNPAGPDDTGRGDDHLRLIKSAIKATFPNITGVMTATQDQLNGVAALIDAATSYLLLDGTRAMTGALQMGSQKITGLAAGTDSTDAVTKAQLDAAIAAVASTAAQAIEEVWPVGSRMILAGSGANPASLVGFGTWSLVGQDRVMIGAGSSHSRGDTGGSKTVTLTKANLPAHDHLMFVDAAVPSTSLLQSSRGVARERDQSGNNDQYVMNGADGTPSLGTTSEEGSASPVDITPLFEAVNIWQRTA